MIAFNQIYSIKTLQIAFLALVIGIVYIKTIVLARKYSHNSGNYLPIILINTIGYYLFALFIVLLSATVGPYAIENFTSYTIDGNYTMTASEATYYTLQALIAVVIGSYLAQKNSIQR